MAGVERLDAIRIAALDCAHFSIVRPHTERAAGLPAEQDRAAGTLDEFFGSGDSGDPSWASRDIHDVRADAARRRLDERA